MLSPKAAFPTSQVGAPALSASTPQWLPVSLPASAQAESSWRASELTAPSRGFHRGWEKTPEPQRGLARGVPAAAPALTLGRGRPPRGAAPPRTRARSGRGLKPRPPPPGRARVRTAPLPAGTPGLRVAAVRPAGAERCWRMWRPVSPRPRGSAPPGPAPAGSRGSRGSSPIPRPVRMRRACRQRPGARSSSEAGSRGGSLTPEPASRSARPCPAQGRLPRPRTPFALSRPVCRRPALRTAGTRAGGPPRLSLHLLPRGPFAWSPARLRPPRAAAWPPPLSRGLCGVDARPSLWAAPLGGRAPQVSRSPSLSGPPRLLPGPRCPPSACCFGS